MDIVRIAALQAPEFREDIDASLAYAEQAITQASAHGAKLICFPECFLQGYLLDETKARQYAIDLASLDFQCILDRLSRNDMVIIFGLIEKSAERLFNTAIVIQNGALKGRYRKTHLLRSEDFFTSGAETPVFSVSGLRFGLNICYDTNFPDLTKLMADKGAELIVCLSNNMMLHERAELYRHVHNSVRGDRCKEQGIWLVSSDVFGERDGRVSWGPTAVIDPNGEVLAQLPLGQAGILFFDIPKTSRG